jgi:hypothetical protein
MALTEKNYQGDLLKEEISQNITRKNVTVVAVAALKAGQVLGIKTSDSKYYPSVDGAADGTQNAVAILLDDLAITTGAVVPVIRRLAVVDYNFLFWDTSYNTQPKKDTAVAYLESASTIIVKTAI